MTTWAGKTPTADQWRDILEQHARWCRGDPAGARADLTGAVLRDADLRNADLRNADLRGADLRGADLRNAVLRGAVLRNAVLRDADLRNADLRNADLTDAVLTGADLTDAVLTGADLRGVVLRGAVLTDADRARLSILPAGDLIGWKKCSGGVLVKLRIPAEAKRSNATGRKCRAEYADVLETIGAAEGRTNQTGQGGSIAVYRVGERVIPDSWDDDWTRECSHGIHFFITREEAEAWLL